MGWLYKHDPIDDPVAYLTDQYTHDAEHHTYRVLAAARVANTVYMAVKNRESHRLILCVCRCHPDLERQKTRLRL